MINYWKELHLIYFLFTPPKKPVSIWQCGQLHQQRV